MDHGIPKILKAVNLPKGKNVIKGNQQIDQTETKMFGLFPRKAPDYVSTTTTRSSLITESSIFDPEVSFSLSSKDRDDLNKHGTSTSLIPLNQFLDLNSQCYPEKVEAQETVSNSHFHGKFQPYNKASSFVTGNSHLKLMANPLYLKNNSYGDLSKAKTGEISTSLL